MEQFSLEKYLANPSRKVVTRGGKNVRILYTNRKLDSKEVVGLTINNDGTEGLLSWSKQGKSLSLNDSSLDLFFAPEKHKGWINIFKYVNTNAYLKESNIYSSKEIAEREGRGYRDYISTIEIEWEE